MATFTVGRHPEKINQRIQKITVSAKSLVERLCDLKISVVSVLSYIGSMVPCVALVLTWSVSTLSASRPAIELPRVRTRSTMDLRRFRQPERLILLLSLRSAPTWKRNFLLPPWLATPQKRSILYVVWTAMANLMRYHRTRSRRLPQAYSGRIRFMTAITSAYAHAYQATSLTRHMPAVPRLNFRLPKPKARYPHLPNIRSTTRERCNDFQGWAIYTDAVLALWMVKTLAGWCAIARSPHGRIDMRFGPVTTTEAHLAFSGARTHSNNTAEMTAMIEVLSFLGPRGPVARDANSCIYYGSKHAAGVCLIPLLALVLATTLETSWKNCVTLELKQHQHRYLRTGVSAVFLIFLYDFHARTTCCLLSALFPCLMKASHTQHVESHDGAAISRADWRRLRTLCR